MSDDLCECCGEREGTVSSERRAWLCEACAGKRLCECCGKREVAAGEWTCEGCRDDASCLCESCAVELDPDDEDELCKRCRDIEERHGWIEETCEEVKALAEKHGWDCTETSRAETGSRYHELTRGLRTLIVRIADHATAYAREDISIAMWPSGDDHCLADLERVLSRPGEEEVGDEE